MDLNNTMKDVTDGVTDKITEALKEGVEDKINDVTSVLVDKVESLADTVGLGAVVDSLVEAVEEKVGLDIDGDKEVVK